MTERGSTITESPGKRVVAVIVTHNRPDDLKQLLATLNGQTIQPDTILVVDNGGRDDTASAIAGCSTAILLNGRMNLGGAGGFALGMLHALTYPADFVWVMDDDGLPAAPDTLERLIEAGAEDGRGCSVQKSTQPSRIHLLQNAKFSIRHWSAPALRKFSPDSAKDTPQEPQSSILISHIGKTSRYTFTVHPIVSKKLSPPLFGALSNPDTIFQNTH